MAYDRQDQRNWRSQGQGYGGRSPRDDHDQDHRGFFERAGEEVRSWFGDDGDRERYRGGGQGYGERDRYGERDFGHGSYESQNAGIDRGQGGRSYGQAGYGQQDRPARRGQQDQGGYGSGLQSRAGQSGYDTQGQSDRWEYGGGARGAFGSSEMGGYGTTYGGPDSGNSPYRGGTYQESGRSSYDPHYSQWRQRQLQELDRDYADYCREHQQRFDQEFGSWRQQRQGQRQTLGKVREHQEVVGSDGAHIGTVDKVAGDRIILTRTDPEAGGHHHSIPCSWVARVEDKVELNRSAEQAQQAWKDEESRSAIGGEQSDGPHVLNRGFAGTY